MIVQEGGTLPCPPQRVAPDAESKATILALGWGQGPAWLVGDQEAGGGWGGCQEGKRLDTLCCDQEHPWHLPLFSTQVSGSTQGHRVGTLMTNKEIYFETGWPRPQGG